MDHCQQIDKVFVAVPLPGLWLNTLPSRLALDCKNNIECSIYSTNNLMAKKSNHRLKPIINHTELYSV